MIINLVAIISGFNFLILALVLFIKEFTHKGRNRYLAFIFFISAIIQCIYTFIHYFLVHDTYFLKYYIPVDLVMMMLLGPLFLFYSLSITNNKVSALSRNSILLFSALPALIFFVFVINMSVSMRIEYILGNLRNTSWKLGILIILFYINTVLCIFLSLKKLKLFRNRLSSKRVIKYDLETKWFKNYILLLLILLILSFPICLYYNNGQINIIIGQLILSIQFMYIYIKVLWNSQLFYQNYK